MRIVRLGHAEYLSVNQDLFMVNCIPKIVIVFIPLLL